MDTKQKILIVDDEEAICEVLRLNLEIAGYEVDEAHSAEEALKKPLTQYSLILLDVMMGEMSGFDFTSLLRSNEQMKNIPIILCTAKDAEEDLLTGFNRGADDYVRKPFSMQELLVRVRSVLRRTELGKSANQKETILEYETLRLDGSRKFCTIGGVEMYFTKKEFEILWLLMSNRNKIFSREEILDLVWEDNVLVIDRTIDVNINRLRKKLGEYGNNIITKLGYGYGFKE